MLPYVEVFNWSRQNLDIGIMPFLFWQITLS
jgi:hypothetical protein